MDGAQNKTGFFLFSLDTELAWGYYDDDMVRSRRFSADGSRERKAVERLLDIFDEFNIVATWAVVGHLMLEKCEECEVCLIADWKGKYLSYNQVYGSMHPLWYGADVATLLQNRGPQHEIAFHGYTHQVFDEKSMSHMEAEAHVKKGLEIFKRMGVTPGAVCFPRNRIGHLDVFRENGFTCYRGEQHVPRLYNLRFFGKTIKTIDYMFAFSSPPVYKLELGGSSGLVNLPSSQYFFGFSLGVEKILDSINLHQLRIRRLIKGVRKAAEEKKVMHIWAHPCDFQTLKDYEKLRYLLGAVRDEMSTGRMQSIGMSTLVSTL